MTDGRDDQEIRSAGAHATPDERTSDRGAVMREIDEMKTLAASLTIDELRSGTWFAKLLAHSLVQYREKVDAEYFNTKYPGMPRDAVVDARIAVAARYAGIEGGLSAAAYTGAVAATIGSLGGASPLTVSAGVLSFSADLFCTTALQLRLAYDIAVLYRVPIDFDDPEDVWRFVRVAFAIRAADTAQTAVGKAVPALMRPLVKKIFSGSTLAAGKSLPVIGKHLLQRNIIKFAIPVVGIPASTAVNYWTTRVAGSHARTAFRTRAESRERARRLARKAPPHRASLWVAWMVLTTDGRPSEAGRMLMHELISAMRSVHGIEDPDLQDVVTLDRDDVWDLVEDVRTDRRGLVLIGQAAAAVDGRPASGTARLVEELSARCK